eukprot:CAMPEP_0201892280 /NCGR_PEP_ID=MMETSP0902-20130614/36129_1 /ASSEMBLY_ACC=CAM_ASM_000551 /TAXON_ID=420261 /ORGANISM="Thalassiosira antarctica, Strain CCMP982" /LENGTH=120 /DNA_ID=CAMNT_0048423701 /DNA_START=91 /DNA_END=453 /DNA_ORIENTATION=+
MEAGGGEVDAAGMSQLLDSAKAIWMSFAAVADMPEVVASSAGEGDGRGGDGFLASKFFLAIVLVLGLGLVMGVFFLVVELLTSGLAFRFLPVVAAIAVVAVVTPAATASVAAAAGSVPLL